MENLFPHLRLILLTFVISCSGDLKKIEINQSILENKKVDFCEIIDHPWDSALIVVPYMRREIWQEFQIQNLRSIKKELIDMESIDWKSYVVVINGQRAVSYLEIPRNLLDIKIEMIRTNPFLRKEKCRYDVENNIITVSSHR